MRICECEFRGGEDRSVFAILHPIVAQLLPCWSFPSRSDFAFQAKERIRARLPERANLFASKNSLRSLLSFVECHGTPYAQVLLQSGQRKPCLPAFKALPVADMTLKIFLNDKSFHCLKQAIPPKSLSKVLVEEAVHLNFFGSNTVLICDEAQARNLLLYVGHCPGVVTSIQKALLSAGLSLDSPIPDQPTDSPTRHPIPPHGPRRT